MILLRTASLDKRDRMYLRGTCDFIYEDFDSHVRPKFYEVITRASTSIRVSSDVLIL